MKIRKMKFVDLQFVNKKFFFGKGINVASLKSNYIYVAEDKKEIKGILFADVTKTGTAILFAIEVLKEYRKRGIAKKMMKRFEKDILKNGTNSIMVFYNKLEGIEPFYEKLNYEIGTNLKVALKIV